MEPTQTIGERIKEARLTMRGLNQSEFARRIGSHRTTIIRWEQDRSEVPVRSLKKISEVLNIPLNYFLA